jgi:O-antigen ligase
MLVIQLIFSSVLGELSRGEADRFSLDEILYGGSSASGRFANVITLATAWAQQPQAWLAGLGYNAFTAYSLSGEPYSHVLFADILFELGPVGTSLMIAILYLGFRSSIDLIRMTKDDGSKRPAAAILLAMLIYQLILVNKQGALWGVPIIFLFLCMGSAIHRHEVANWEAPEPDATGPREAQPS